MDSFVTLFASVANLILAAIVFYRGRFRSLSLSFAIFSLMTGVWVLTNYFFQTHPSLLLIKSQYATGAAVLPLALIWFNYFLQVKVRRLFTVILICYGAIMFVLPFVDSLIVVSLSPDSARIILGPFFDIYSLALLVPFSLLFIQLITFYNKTDGIKRKQIGYILLGAGMFGGISMVFSFVLPFFGVIPVAPIDAQSSLFFVAASTYAITRYRLMNIQHLLSRSVLYFLLISLIGSVFVFTAYLTSSVFAIDSKLGVLESNLVTSIVIVILYDPLKKILSKLTDDIFFKGKIEYDQVLEKISRILAQEIDLELLLSKIQKGIETEVKIKKVDVWVKMSDKFYSFSEKSPVEGTFEPEFISYLQKENNLIVTEELKRQLYDLPEGAARSQLEKMASIIDRSHWEMAIPVTDKGEVTAILGLHHKLSGDIYTGEEINFFGIVAGQLAVAIEKSKLYEEVGRFNEELQAKVDRATQRLRQNNIDLEARNKFLTTTQNISNLISRSLEIKNIIQVIADSIASELGYIGGILSFADADKKFLYAAAITRSEAGMKALSMLPKPANEYRSSIKNKDNLGVKIFSSGQAMTGPKLSDFLSPPVEKDVMDKIQLALGAQTVVGVPIYAENEIIGVIDYLLAVPEAQISKLDMEMMNNLADQIGIVYRNVKLYQELEGANKELQQANFHLMQLDKAKSEFLSIASHQLRTPVSAIKGYLSMMIEGDFGVVKPEQKKIITDVFESASRLARTINVFLNVSRIEAGRFKLTKAPIDMNTVTEGVIKELKQQAAIKNVKLEWLPPAKPCTIIVDGDKVREVVLNLVDNSIKYTQEGFVRVTQDMTPTEFHFQVTDSGMGILPEEVGTLFKKFVRGTGVAQVNTSGSGLGLYIAQRVVKEHGGKIWVESPGVGKGSTFQFTIPIETVISDKVQSKEMIESTEAKPLTESKEKK